MWFNDGINEEAGQLAISKKKSEGDVGPQNGCHIFWQYVGPILSWK